MKSWKTTTCGIIGGSGLLLQQFFGEYPLMVKVGAFMAAFGLMMGSVFAQDACPREDCPQKNKIPMNPKTLILFVLAGFTALFALTPGCVTGPDGKSVPDVALMTATAKNASFLGTSLYLKGRPDERGKFETAREALDVLIAGGTFDTAQLTAALQSLPINELKGDQGALYVGVAITLWDAYGRKLAEIDKDKVFDSYVLPVAVAIRDGLDMGLNPISGH